MASLLTPGRRRCGRGRRCAAAPGSRWAGCGSCGPTRRTREPGTRRSRRDRRCRPARHRTAAVLPAISSQVTNSASSNWASLSDWSSWRTPLWARRIRAFSEKPRSSPWATVGVSSKIGSPSMSSGGSSGGRGAEDGVEHQVGCGHSPERDGVEVDEHPPAHVRRLARCQGWTRRRCRSWPRCAMGSRSRWRLAQIVPWSPQSSPATCSKIWARASTCTGAVES